AGAAGFVVVGIGVNDRELVETALARLLGGMGEMAGGVEFLDRERSRPAGGEFHTLLPNGRTPARPHASSGVDRLALLVVLPGLELEQRLRIGAHGVARGRV